MDPKFEINLRQFEQLEETVWGEITAFVEKWNQTKENKFINDVPFQLAIYFSEETDKEMQELERILEQKHKEREWVWAKIFIKDLSAKAVEALDYIQFIGDGYPDKFFLNESDALSPVEPCETCGMVHPHLAIQKNFLQVNETYLDRKKAEPNNKYSPPGLDIVNMPNGALLVSKSVVELIKKDKNVHGYKFLDVIDQKGEISERLFQLAVDKIILRPDNLSEEEAICPTCGAVLQNLTKTFAVKKSRLGKSSFFSRNPLGISSMYMSNSLYHFLKSENVRGLGPVQGADLIND